MDAKFQVMAVGGDQLHKVEGAVTCRRLVFRAEEQSMVGSDRLAKPRDVAATGLLARPVARRWILPDQPASAAPLRLADLTARVIRAKIFAGQRFLLTWQGDGRLLAVAQSS